ncbi:hypothetical protein HDU76_006202 [Blyttiomyces sp. JEL0837]|nr:hypothetical protein HDU76_006202 [Blyttiomyces sp. JEL0837]
MTTAPAASTASSSATAGRQLFVGNLPFIVGWQDLKDLFRETGHVVRADVAESSAGKSRGFGTVLFATVEEAKNAINAFNNYEWHGRKIEVREDRAVSGSAAAGAGAPAAAGGAGYNAQTNGADAAGQFNNKNKSGPKRIDGEGDAENATAAPVAGATNGDNIAVRALYVGNLPYSVGWQDLKDLFRNAGNVVRADVPMDYQSRSKGFGTVQMSTVEEARKAVGMYNGYEWNGRRIEVREDRTFVEGAPARQNPTGHYNNNQGPNMNQQGGYPSFPNAGPVNNAPMASGQGLPPMVGGASTAGRQLFVGNLPFTVQWQELKDLFRQAGTVQRADVAMDNQARSRGYGQILMATADEAAAAIKMLNGFELQGRAIEVREDKYASEGGSPAPGTQVFVGNLPYSTRWQDLKDLFRPHGLNPIHADIMTEPGTGRSKGCGVVRFATREEAEKAVATVNGNNVAGRNVVVRLDKFA